MTQDEWPLLDFYVCASSKSVCTFTLKRKKREFLGKQCDFVKTVGNNNIHLFRLENDLSVQMDLEGFLSKGEYKLMRLFHEIY